MKQMNIAQLEEDEFFKSKRRKRRSSSRKARRRSAIISSRNSRKQRTATRKVNRRIKKNSIRIQRGKKPKYAIRPRILNPVSSRRRVRKIVKRSTRKPDSRSTAKKILFTPKRIFRSSKRRFVPVRPVKPILRANLNEKIRPINAKKAGIRPVQTMDRKPERRVIRPAVKNLTPVKTSQINSDPIGQVPKSKSDQPFGRSTVVKRATAPTSSKRMVMTAGEKQASKQLTSSKTLVKIPDSKQRQTTSIPARSAPVITGKAGQESQLSGLPANEEQGSKMSNRSKYLLLGGLALLTLAVGYRVFKYVNSPIVTIS